MEWTWVWGEVFIFIFGEFVSDPKIDVSQHVHSRFDGLH